MGEFVISSTNAALLNVLSEMQKADLLDAIICCASGEDPSGGLDDMTKAIYSAFVLYNNAHTPAELHSLLSQSKESKESREKENAEKKKSERKERSRLFEDDSVCAAYDEFVRMRKQIKKPLTDLAETKAINKLERLADGDIEKARLILEQSVFHCWQDLYELKDNKPQQQTKTSTVLGQRNPKIQQAYGFSTERNTDYNAEVWRRIRERWEAEDGTD